MLETQVNQNITVTGYPGDKPVATMWESKGKITLLKGWSNAIWFKLQLVVTQVHLYLMKKNESLAFIGVAFQINLTVRVFINENVRNFLKQNIEDINFANDDHLTTLIIQTIQIIRTILTTLITLTTLIIRQS